MSQDNVDVTGLWITLLSSQNIDQNFPSLISLFPWGLLKIPVTIFSCVY